jgi:hypothetical protein
MENYFELLRRHGLMLWASFLVGSLAAGIIVGIAAVILGIISVIVLFAGAADALSSLQESLNPDSPDLFAYGDEFFSPEMIFPLLIIGLLFIGIFLLYSGFTSAGTNSIMQKTVFEDRSSIEIYFSQGFRYMFKMVGQQLLIFLLCLPVWIPLILGIVLIVYGSTAGSAGSFLGGLFLLLISIVLFVVLALAFMHAPVILVTENTGIWKSIALSFRLFKESFGQVFLSGLIVFLINLMFGGIMFVLGLIFVDPPAASSADISIGGDLFFSLLRWIVSFFIQVLSLLAIFVRYRNLLRPRLFPEKDDNGGEIGGTRIIWG